MEKFFSLFVIAGDDESWLGDYEKVSEAKEVAYLLAPQFKGKHTEGLQFIITKEYNVVEVMYI